MNITEVCVKKPVFAWMLMAATVVFGVVAISRIGISQLPDVDFPTINVSVNWEGAAPEVMENEVVEPMEEALTQVEGLLTITSTCRQGSANITLELDISRNVDLALQDVQTKVSQAQRRLPRDIDPPTIGKTNPEDQPIIWAALSGPFPQRVLSDYTRYQLKEKLQTIPGVGEISVGGALDRNVRIWLDAERLDAKGLTVQDVIAALQREHVELPAGRLETQGREVNIRVLGEAIDIDTLKRIVIRQTENSPIYLEDVSLVEDGFEDMRRLARVNGIPAQGVGVRKQRGANAVAVAREIKKALVEIQKTLPAGMSVDINVDSTKFIEESVREIQFELILSVLLTALVCWMFLGSLSSTMNVVLAIPMSLLGTIAAMYFFGFTFNTFTLLGLILAVGIVVDDAIMVMENIYRHAEAGKPLRAAALEGTKEIAFAALAATLAVVAIFLPVVFIKGVIGRFFLQFGITLCVAVLLSYVEAVTLAPSRCAQFLKTSREGRSKVGIKVDDSFTWMSRKYAGALRRSLKRPGLVLLIALAVLVGSIFIFKMIPGEFVPSQDQSLMMIRIQAAVGSDIRETDALIRKTETALFRHPEVERIFANIGGMGGGGVSSGMMFVTLVPRSKRDLSQAEITQQIRRELNAIPGVRAVIQDLSQRSFTAQRGFPVEFSVRGSDWERLVIITQGIMKKLEASGVVIDLDTDYRLGMPELQIQPDRGRCSDVGVSINDVATTLSAMVGGIRVGKYSSGGRRLDVRLKLLAEQRSRPEDLARLQVRSKTGELIPLSSLVNSREIPALQAITRKDRERAISIFANIAPGHSQDEALNLVEQLSGNLPVGYRAVLGGASLTFRESMGSLFFALWLGILVAYMILASQFNSFLHPVTVLTILPLSIAGAVLALLITGHTMNVFSMIGLLLLMGIVKKNSIILVDYANQNRELGLDAREAMEKAGPIRLRPILMTAASTLMAAIPPSLGLGPGSEIRTPMAIAVIGGLILSTALSLIVVPAFYVYTDRIRQKLIKKKP